MTQGNHRPLAPHQRLRALLGCAVRAPSSHNTQPWRFVVADGTVDLRADRTRALPANDPEDRELTISCGCALMNLRVAAAREGLGVVVRTAPDPDDDDLLARVSFTGAGPPDAGDAALFDAIDARRTHRGAFRDEAVPATWLDLLAAAAAGEGAWLEALQATDRRRRLAALVAAGDTRQWSNPRWRRELAAWMRPAGRGDGLAVPGAVAPLARLAVRTAVPAGVVRSRDRRLAVDAPLVAVLGTAGDGVDDWLALGQALQKVLLTACAQGLQASYLNQPVQVAALRPELAQLLGHRGLPQIVLRLGFPRQGSAPAPRRHLDAVAGEAGAGEAGAAAGG